MVTFFLKVVHDYIFEDVIDDLHIRVDLLPSWKVLQKKEDERVDFFSYATKALLALKTQISKGSLSCDFFSRNVF